MKRLNKEQINNIETYLENSDVRFADIRLDMTDHVASGIEEKINAGDDRDFYDLFKEYMVDNKDQLLNENKKFIKSVDKENTKLIFKELLTFKTAVIFIGLMTMSFYMFKEFNPKILRNIFAIPLLSMVPIAIVYFICSKKYNYSRFSGVERLGFIYTVLFQVIHFISIVFKPNIKDGLSNITISIAFSVCIVLIYTFVSVSYKRIKSYLLIYKAIA